MSDVYYLASDTEFEELKNPYIIYEKRGVVMTSPFAEFYPRTFRVDKKEFENHLAKADEIEFLNVWLGGNDKIKTKKYC